MKITRKLTTVCFYGIVISLIICLTSVDILFYKATTILLANVLDVIGEVIVYDHSTVFHERYSMVINEELNGILTAIWITAFVISGNNNLKKKVVYILVGIVVAITLNLMYLSFVFYAGKLFPEAIFYSRFIFLISAYFIPLYFLFSLWIRNNVDKPHVRHS